jgi:hypothetical protein
VSQAWLGNHQIGSPARRLGDVILRQPVDEVDVRANHLANAAYLLENVISMMQNELKIKAGNILTSPASAGCGALDIGLLVAKCQIRRLDQLQNRLTS